MKANLKFLSLSVMLGASILLGACNSNEETSANVGDGSEVYEIVMTHELPEVFHKHEYMEKFKELVEERSDNRLSVKIYPAATLFKDTEAMEAIGTGAVQMVWPVSSHLESLSNEYGIVSLPFGISDEKMNDENFRAELTKILNGYVDDKGIKVLGLLRTAEGMFLAKDVEMQSINELAGLKIRTVSGHISGSMMEAIDATAVAMPSTELATSLSQGAIDGVNTSPDGWRDVVGSIAKYGYVVPDMQIFTYSMVVDNIWFEKLPEDLQTIIEETADEIVEEQWKTIAEIDVEIIEEVTSDWGTIHYADEQDTEQWRQKMEYVYEKFEESNPEAYKQFTDLLEK